MANFQSENFLILQVVYHGNQSDSKSSSIQNEVVAVNVCLLTSSTSAYAVKSVKLSGSSLLCCNTGSFLSTLHFAGQFPSPCSLCTYSLLVILVDPELTQLLDIKKLSFLFFPKSKTSINVSNDFIIAKFF